MSTPEGAVKDKVKKLLAAYGIFPASRAGAFPELACGWYYMPTQAGLGVKGIPDFIGFVKSSYWEDPIFFAVETKAPGRKPTGFQHLQIEAIRTAGGVVFVVDGDTSEFETWLKGGR